MAAAIEESVADAFAIVCGDDRKWARDWLMAWDSDPAGDVNAISNPIAAAKCDTTFLTVTAAATSQLGQARPMGSTGVCTYVSSLDFISPQSNLPTWIQGGLTIGIMLKLMNSCPGVERFPHLPTPPEPAKRVVGRFVRDEKTGETLLIDRTSEPNRGPSLCSIMLFRPTCTTMREHLFMLCDGESLQQRTKSPRSFADAVIIFDKSLGQREGGCPVCWRVPPPGDSCGCALPLLPPASPLDFGRFKTNSTFLAGRYTCANTLMLLAPGDTPGRPLIDTGRGMLRLTNDPVEECSLDAIEQSLYKLAIQDRMYQANPCRAVMPLTSDPSQYMGDNAAPGLDDNLIQPAQFVSGWNTQDFPPGNSDRFPQPGAPLGSMNGSHTSRTGGSNCTGSARRTSNTQSGTGGVLGTTPGRGPGTRAPGSFSGAFSQQVYHLDQRHPLRIQLNPLHTQLDPLHTQLYIPDGRGASSGAAGSRHAPGNPQAFEPSSADNTPSTSVARANAQSLGRSTSDDELLAKAMERQRRNRLSASRSNALRKERRETLVRAVREATERREELERRRDALRRENAILKTRAALHWVSSVRGSDGWDLQP